jgi:hypothetical protein
LAGELVLTTPENHPFIALHDRKHARHRLALLVLADVAVVVGHRLGRVPDDGAHDLAVRDAPELVVRGMAQTVRRHAPIDLAHRECILEHFAQRVTLVQLPLLGREDPALDETRMLRRDHLLPAHTEHFRHLRQQRHDLRVRVVVIAGLRRGDDTAVVVAALDANHGVCLVDVRPAQRTQLAPAQPHEHVEQHRRVPPRRMLLDVREHVAQLIAREKVAALGLRLRHDPADRRELELADLLARVLGAGGGEDRAQYAEVPANRPLRVRPHLRTLAFGRLALTRRVALGAQLVDPLAKVFGADVVDEEVRDLRCRDVEIPHHGDLVRARRLQLTLLDASTQPRGHEVPQPLARRGLDHQTRDQLVAQQLLQYTRLGQRALQYAFHRLSLAGARARRPQPDQVFVRSELHDSTTLRRRPCHWQLQTPDATPTDRATVPASERTNQASPS